MSEQDIFLVAIEIVDPAARTRYLNDACEGNLEMRSEVQRLLDAHMAAGEFLNDPAINQFLSDLSDCESASTQTTNTAEPDKRRPVGAADQNSDDAVVLGFLSPSTKSDSLGRLGHYEVYEMLGHGAFGIVLRAFDEKLRRTVAIKVLSPELAATSPPRKRFLREARASAAIRHEQVVAIYAVEEQPIPYLVMEYVPGLNLHQALQARGPFDVLDVLRIGQQIACGLAAAHAQGLIHRDIKPANILIESHVGGRVKITDFGLARTADDASLTQSGVIAGTPMYMSPEQAVSGVIDQRSDLFSLGSVLYVMVSGRPPFRASTTLAVLKRVVEDAPRPIPEIVPDVPAWLCSIIAKLQAKQPDNRFSTATEVAELLGQCLSDMHANRSVQLPPSILPVPGPTKVTASPDASIVTKELISPHSRSRVIQPRWSAIAAISLLLLIVSTSLTELVGVTNLTSILKREAKNNAGSTKPNESLLSAQPPVIKIPELESFTPVTIDLTPPEPLGTWEMGPEPPWFGERGWRTRYMIKRGDILPGLIERPARLLGVSRWNIDTVWARGRVNVAHYSPDSQWLATGAHDGHVRIYAADSMELVSLIPGRCGEHGVLDISWHPDSERLAIAADGHGFATAFRIWSRTGQLLFEESEAEYGSVAWSHSGELIADGSSHHRLVLRTGDGTVVKTLVEGERAGVLSGGSIVWSPNDQQIACRHVNGDVLLWNVGTGESELLMEKSDCANGFGLAWGSAGWLAVSDGPNLRLFHPEQHMTRTIKFAEGLIPNRIAWYPDGLRGISTNGYTNLCQWDCDNEQAVVRDKIDYAANNSLTISSDGRRVAFAKSVVCVFDPDLKQLKFSSPKSTQAISELAWSSDGQQLAGTHADAGGITVWSSEGRTNSIHTMPTHGARLKSGPAGDMLIFAGNPPGVVWIMEPSQLPRKLITANVTSADWGPDGQHIALGTNAGTVIILDRRGQIVTEIKVDEGNTQVGWSRASNLIAVHCGQKIFLCDPNNGWELNPGATTTRRPMDRQEPIWAPSGEQFSLINEGWFDLQGNRVADRSPCYLLEWRPDGKRYLQGWFDSRLPSGTSFAVRDFNGFTFFFPPRYNPRGNLVGVGYVQGAITVCREADQQPYWHAVLLPENHSATFSAAGELLDGDRDKIEKLLVYYVEREDGQIDILKPSAFQTLAQPRR